MAYWKLSMCAAAAWGAALGTSGTLAQQFNSEQIQMINQTAASICNTVKEAKGQKSDIQIQGDVNAKLNGLLGKVVDIGGSGKGALTREEFEGLSRDATATALQGDRDCRERLFYKMFDKLNAAPDPRPPGKPPTPDTISGTYKGILIAEVINVRGGRIEISVPVTLVIDPMAAEDENKFHGSIIVCTAKWCKQTQSHYINGEVYRNTIAFMASDKDGDAFFEGALTGNSINGTISAPTEFSERKGLILGAKSLRVYKIEHQPAPRSSGLPSSASRRDRIQPR